MQFGIVQRVGGLGVTPLEAGLHQIAGNNRAMRETFIVEIARGTNNPWLVNGLVDP